MSPEELVVNLFAGGGGTSVGIEQALGRGPDIAINHDQIAIAMHAANHPSCRHFTQDVWQVLPRQATGGKPVGLLWASPDCTHHSRAKGGPPVRDVKKRDLAWVVVRWIEEVRPRVVILENVEEFLGWGPLDKENHVIKSQKGVTFRAFCKRIRRHGYALEWEVLRACDYGAPTSRERLFIIARCDGEEIVWPAPSHGDPKSLDVRQGWLLPWRTAAEIIDWGIACPSIFERKKPLAENTQRRIAEGIKRYVIESADPFIVNLTHGGRLEPLDDPMRTITGAHRGEKALAVPYVASYYGQKRNEARGREIDKPIATITADNRHALVAPYIARIGQTGGGGSYCKGADDPLTTITSKAEHLLVTPYLVGAGGPEYSGKPVPIDCPLGTVLGENHRNLIIPHLQRQFGNSVGQDAEEPVGTIMPGGSGKTALVSAFLAKHYGGVVGQDMEKPIGTVTGIDHHALVASSLVKFKGTSKAGQALSEPLQTVQAGAVHYAEVRAFLVKYFGSAIGQDVKSPLHTITGKDREALVTVLVGGVPHVIYDIGMRMLTPWELFMAQGFPRDFIVDVEKIDKRGKTRPISNEDKVHLCGNSVPPDFARALIWANCTEEGAGAVQMRRQLRLY